MRVWRKWGVRTLLLAGLMIVAFPGRPAAHEIPTDVLVRVFVRPSGDRMTVLVRAPLEAMRDMQFPLFGPGYLDIERAGEEVENAAILWVGDYLNFYEDGNELEGARLVASRVSLPSDRSFATYDGALAHFQAAPLHAATQLPWQQAMLDAQFEVPITSDSARFAIDSRLAHLGLRTVTALQFVPPSGGARVFEFTGDQGRVELDPSWTNAVLRFVALGFEHILDGLDHLLFLLCLVLPARRFRVLVPVVTAFTVAHSITLIAAAFGLTPRALWFPPFIETLIALSIVYMALENIAGAKVERRWWMAFAFGLVHGFGFSFALSETLQFAGAHLLASLLSFNIGVELGQLFVVVLMLPVLAFLFSRVVAERMGIILISALVAHTSWHWMTERGSDFLAYTIQWPAWNAGGVQTVGRWVALVAVIGVAAWGLNGLYRRWFPDVADPT